MKEHDEDDENEQEGEEVAVVATSTLRHVVMKTKMQTQKVNKIQKFKLTVTIL